MNVKNALAVIAEYDRISRGEAPAGRVDMKNPIASYDLHVKIKSKGSMYYTAGIEAIISELSEERSKAPSDTLPNAKFSFNEWMRKQLPFESQRCVQYVLSMIDKFDGWWFEDGTVWVAKSEVGMIFADVKLIHANGAISD